MTILDLTHLIENGMSVFPGTPAPEMVPAFTVEQHGFAETMLHLVSHTGTHMDAPAHFFGNAKSLDMFTVSDFVGKALLIDCTALSTLQIETMFLKLYEKEIAESEILILKTNQSLKWGTPAYFDPFKAITAEAAQWLTTFNLRGIGVDAISIDLIDSVNYPVHNILLKKGWFIVENLKNLDKIPNSSFTFGAFPLHYKNADGAPVRAVAMW